MSSCSRSNSVWSEEEKGGLRGGGEEVLGGLNSNGKEVRAEAREQMVSFSREAPCLVMKLEKDCLRSTIET